MNFPNKTINCKHNTYIFIYNLNPCQIQLINSPKMCFDLNFIALNQTKKKKKFKWFISRNWNAQLKFMRQWNICQFIINWFLNQSNRLRRYENVKDGITLNERDHKIYISFSYNSVNIYVACVVHVHRKVFYSI